MTSPDPLRRPVSLAAGRGREPRLADFAVAMSEGRRRRRRRGLCSAGAGAALAAVIGVSVGLGGGGGGASAQDEIHFVEQTPDSPAEQVDGQAAHLGVPAMGAPAGELPAADQQRFGPGRSAARGDDADAGPAQPEPHPRRPAYRTKSSTVVPRTCATSVDWCLHATVRSGGKGKGHNLHATLCLNAKQPFGSLDYVTAQEADFEVLAGSRVLWRWSDGQSFARTPHRLSGMTADCFGWQTYWDQYDGSGAKVGAGRLTLRVRSKATQQTDPAAATVTFTTVDF